MAVGSGKIDLQFAAGFFTKLAIIAFSIIGDELAIIFRFVSFFVAPRPLGSMAPSLTIPVRGNAWHRPVFARRACRVCRDNKH